MNDRPASAQGEILRVGAEPVVLWGETEDGSPRFSISAPQWRFRGADRSLLHLGAGSMIAGTPLDEGGLSLVPSDPLPDLEHGRIRIAGFTLAEMREVRLERGRQGWAGWRAPFVWHWTRMRWRLWRWRLRGGLIRRKP